MSEKLCTLRKIGGGKGKLDFAFVAVNNGSFGSVGISQDGILSRSYYNNTGLTCDYCKVVATQTPSVCTVTFYKDCYISGLYLDSMKTQELHQAGTSISTASGSGSFFMIYPV